MSCRHKYWDICKFIAAIEREAGSRLEELFVVLWKDRWERRPPTPILPGKVSMQGFERLRKLEFPVEIAMCSVDVAVAAARDAMPSEFMVGAFADEIPDGDTLISDLVPASVSQLSLVLSRQDNHEKALDAMFRDFAAKQRTRLRALQAIYLTVDRLSNLKKAYAPYERLRVETEKAFVDLHCSTGRFVRSSYEKMMKKKE